MRKSFDGLSAAVMEVLERDPLSGHLFLFLYSLAAGHFEFAPVAILK